MFPERSDQIRDWVHLSHTFVAPYANDHNLTQSVIVSVTEIPLRKKQAHVLRFDIHHLLD